VQRGNRQRRDGVSGVAEGVAVAGNKDIALWQGKHVLIGIYTVAMAKGDRESLVCVQDFSLKVSRARADRRDLLRPLKARTPATRVAVTPHRPPRQQHL
jgi:hypothetical protein